jgi:hypothetical protein
VRVVYGNVKPIEIASDLSAEEAEAYAARMNEQAPQYNHRTEEE